MTTIILAVYRSGGRENGVAPGMVHCMELLVIALLFVGLALLAAVPLVALLHWSDR